MTVFVEVDEAYVATKHPKLYFSFSLKIHLIYFHSYGNIECMDNTSAVLQLASLAQEARLKIFRLLVQAGKEGLPAGNIGESLQIPASTLSFHLKELSHAGLISARQESRFIFYAANYAAMNDLLAFLTENCCLGSNPKDTECTNTIEANPCC